ncbi:DUF6879 family protein [Streptomyces sp. URMC 129]|uniref:DUF6879 family protein n=1 Tax=Streptomyces sp. URMC 129 TaxID=3423407 RepID=UPI003F1D0A12
MLDLVAPALDPAQGEILDQAAYKRDFRERDAEVRGHDSWKFERRQHFEEQASPSRDALRRGDWQGALRLMEERRDAHAEAVRRERMRATTFHRVRVVEEPPTPYLQWELHSLRVQAQSGKPIRVVHADKVSALEGAGLLPEVVVLGGKTLYSIAYTAEGVPDGAVRFTDPGLIKGWEHFVRALYAEGEDVVRYVDRCIAHLPPPGLKPE